MRRRARQRGIEILSQGARDQKFLKRVFSRSGDKFNERETGLITKLVNRYHDVAYEEINHMTFVREPLGLETLLDNFDFILGKIKGGKPARFEHASQIIRIYDLAPDTCCHLRTAPLAVRRKALVVVRLCRLLEEATGLPDDCYQMQGNGPSSYLIEMGMKYWNRLDQMIGLLLDPRRPELPVIDVIMEDGLVTPLTNGVL